jgi:hypothetical protein
MVLLLGCTRREGTISDAGLPMVTETPLAVPVETDQTLRVTIENGRFASTIYQEQTGATQMLVITLGGPYLFEIDDLVRRRELAADSRTVIVYDTSATGQYTMRAYRSTPSGPSDDFASAVLDVAPVGGR